MTNLTTKVDKAASNDTCVFVPPGPFKLDANATLTVNVGINFPAGTAITMVTFYGKDNGAKDPKNILGTWSLPDANPTTSVVVVPGAIMVGATQGGGGVVVTDIWGSASDADDMYFGLTLTDGIKSWYPDPELILKKSTQGFHAAEG